MSASLTVIKQAGAQRQAKDRQNKRMLFAGLAFAMFGSGFILPVLGLVFAVLHSVISQDFYFGPIGTWMMILSIPMLIIGSHLMDLIEKHK